MTASQREQAAGPGELPGDAEVRALTGRVAVVTGGGRERTVGHGEKPNARILDQLVSSITHVYKAPDSAINSKRSQGAR